MVTSRLRTDLDVIEETIKVYITCMFQFWYETKSCPSTINLLPNTYYNKYIITIYVKDYEHNKSCTNNLLLFIFITTIIILMSLFVLKFDNYYTLHIQQILSHKMSMYEVMQ